jgi:hypothetical protein
MENQTKEKKIISRKFLGEMNNELTEDEISSLQFSEDPEVATRQLKEAKRMKANYNKAHLKAYLKGKNTFHWGYVSINVGTPELPSEMRIHARHQVKQEFIYED